MDPVACLRLCLHPQQSRSWQCGCWVGSLFNQRVTANCSHSDLICPDVLSCVARGPTCSLIREHLEAPEQSYMARKDLSCILFRQSEQVHEVSLWAFYWVPLERSIRWSHSGLRRATALWRSWLSTRVILKRSVRSRSCLWHLVHSIVMLFAPLESFRWYHCGTQEAWSKWSGRII